MPDLVWRTDGISSTHPWRTGWSRRPFRRWYGEPSCRRQDMSSQDGSYRGWAQLQPAGVLPRTRG